MWEFLQAHAAKHGPGFFGALFALLWIKDTWPRRIVFVAAGMAASNYLTPSILLAFPTAVDQNTTAFLVGLFSMACAAKAFETLEALRPKEWIERFLKARGW